MLHAAVCNCWLWRIGCCLASISECKHPKYLIFLLLPQESNVISSKAPIRLLTFSLPSCSKRKLKPVDFFFSFTVCSFRHDCNCNIFHAVYNNGESGRCVVSRWGWTRQMYLLGAKQTRDKGRGRTARAPGFWRASSSLISSHRQHPRPLGLPAISR